MLKRLCPSCKRTLIASPMRRCPDCARVRSLAKGSTTERGLGWSFAKKRPGIFRRDGGICWICGGEGADTVDHVVPRSRGGGNDDDNLKAAHFDCNRRRRA